VRGPFTVLTCSDRVELQYMVAVSGIRVTRLTAGLVFYSFSLQCQVRTLPLVSSSSRSSYTPTYYISPIHPRMDQRPLCIAHLYELDTIQCPHPLCITYLYE
jgi:hypothetical protein